MVLRFFQHARDSYHYPYPRLGGGGVFREKQKYAGLSRLFVLPMTVLVQNKWNTNPHKHKYASSRQCCSLQTAAKTDTTINYETVDGFGKVRRVCSCRNNQPSSRETDEVKVKQWVICSQFYFTFLRCVWPIFDIFGNIRAECFCCRLSDYVMEWFQKGC